MLPSSPDPVSALSRAILVSFILLFSVLLTVPCTPNTLPASSPLPKYKLPTLQEVLPTARTIFVSTFRRYDAKTDAQYIHSPYPIKRVLEGTAFTLATREPKTRHLTSLLHQIKKFDVPPPKGEADCVFMVEAYRGNDHDCIDYDYYISTGVLGRKIPDPTSDTLEPSGKEEWCVVGDEFRDAFRERMRIERERTRIESEERARRAQEAAASQPDNEKEQYRKQGIGRSAPDQAREP